MANVPVIISSTVIQRPDASASSPIVVVGGQPPVNPGGGTFTGIGIRLNGQVIGGVKRFIEQNDFLEIPSYWEYNVFNLDVDGVIEIEEFGMINIMDGQISLST
jgi:hypothetical protein